MFAEGALRIELHRGTKIQVLEVQYDRVLIGSGAHCDVRLAPDEAAIEQLVVQLIGDDEVYAQTKTFDPPVFVNGAPFLEGRLLPTSMLELGSLALSVQRIVRSDGDAPKRQRNKSSTSPLVQVAGLLGVAFGLWTVLFRGGPAGSSLPDAVPPPPMAALATPACPHTGGVAARSLAEQSHLEAENKRERSPFFPGDGLAAMSLFERAAGCFESAGDRDRAKTAHDAALTLREHISDEIHLGQVRLERFLAQSRHADARHQAQLLAQMIPDKASAYTRWLSAVVRESELHK